jgi:hypothetical protein
MSRGDVYFFSIIFIYLSIGLTDILTPDEISIILILSLGLPLIIPPIGRWIFIKK